jgi:hypothetical protein
MARPFVISRKVPIALIKRKMAVQTQLKEVRLDDKIINELKPIMKTKKAGFSALITEALEGYITAEHFSEAVNKGHGVWKEKKGTLKFFIPEKADIEIYHRRVPRFYRQKCFRQEGVELQERLGGKFIPGSILL